MSPESHIINDFFAKLGIEPGIAAIYTALHHHGPQTISQLARNSRVERTKIYRLLDELSRLNLIDTETRYKRTIIRAAPVSNLQLLITARQEELRRLQSGLGLLEQTLGTATLARPSTRIQVYRGPEGLRQMYWNETRSRSENLAVLYENMPLHTGASFFERWVEAYNHRGISLRGVIGDRFLETQRQWYTKPRLHRLARWEARYIPKSIYCISHSTVIYDDIVAYYNWHEGEVFGVELHNADIANAQRQLFRHLWLQATPVDDRAEPTPPTPPAD